MGYGESDWKQLQEKTQHHGQGLALIGANEGLIAQAIAHDVKQDGTVDHDYTQFGLTAGVLERNYIEGVKDYEAQVDTDSEEYNRWLSTGRSTTLFVASFVPVGRPTLEASFGVIDIAAGHFNAEGEVPGLEKDTDNEKQALSDLLDKYVENPTQDRFGEIAKIESVRAAQARNERIVDYDGNEVQVVDTDEGQRLQVKVDGEWKNQPPNWNQNERPEMPEDLPPGPDIGTADAQAEERLGDPHRQGILASNPDDFPNESAEERRERTRAKDVAEDSDIWARLPGKPRLRIKDPLEEQHVENEKPRLMAEEPS